MHQLSNRLPTLSQTGPSDAQRVEDNSRRAYAAKAAAELLGRFRAGTAPDPVGYVTGIAEVLMSYPASIVDRVVHPMHGLPSKMVWPPSISEVRHACDDIYLPQLERERRENERERTMRLLSAPEEPRANRPSIEDIKAKLGPDYGIERTGARKQEPGRTLAELKAEASSWDLEVSSELIANIAEKSALKAGA